MWYKGGNLYGKAHDSRISKSVERVNSAIQPHPTYWRGDNCQEGDEAFIDRNGDGDGGPNDQGVGGSKDGDGDPDHPAKSTTNC